MVERAEDQYHVEVTVAEVQIAGIAHLGRGRDASRGIDMPGHRVHDVHGVAVLDQPPGMRTGAATDIQDAGGR